MPSNRGMVAAPSRSSIAAGLIRKKKDCKMFTAAFLIAFFGFLRISEFTATSHHVPLMESDVIIRGTSPHRRLLMSIRFSKTDQRGAGHVIIIPEGAFLCPVRAASEYIHIRPEQGTAFFSTF